MSKCGFTLTEDGLKRVQFVFIEVFRKIGRPLRQNPEIIRLSGTKIEELKNHPEIRKLKLRFNTKELLVVIMQRLPQAKGEKDPEIITDAHLEQFLKATKKLADYYEISFEWQVEDFIQITELNQEQSDKLNIAQRNKIKKELIQNLQETFYLFNYVDEIASFEKIYQINRPILCFYISGAHGYGQQWLLKRLIDKNIPQDGLLQINLHFDPNFNFLEQQLIKQLKLRQQTSLGKAIQHLSKLYIEENLRCLIKFNISSLNYAPRVLNQVLDEFIKKMWLPLLQESGKVNEGNVAYLFLLNSEGIDFSDTLDNESYQNAHHINHLHLRSSFTYDNIKSWLLRSQLSTEHKREIEQIFQAYKNKKMLPMDVFEIIAKQLGLNFDIDILKGGINDEKKSDG